MPIEEVAGARAMREQRAVQHIETGIMRDDGAVVWIDMSAVPMALPGWRVVVVTFNLSASRGDNTTRQALQEQILRSPDGLARDLSGARRT